jgi:mono/diheme cytochrome c family protein
VRVVACARDRAAIVEGGTVSAIDLRGGTRTAYALEDATALAFVDAAGPEPRLAAVVDDAVYTEDEGGVLRRTEIGSGRLQLAGSPDRLWVLGGRRLYSIAKEGLERHAIEVGEASRLFAANGGEIWIASGARLSRLGSAAPAIAPDAWSAIEPVFARACSRCHRAGGASGLDLSTPLAWGRHRARIGRVLHTRVMPPPEVPLDDAERDLLMRELAK